jgi:hypothetical protein
MTPRRPGRSPRLLLLGCGFACACGSSLPTVPVGPRDESAKRIPIETAPPPAKVETVPPKPGSACAWLDGRWESVDGGWQWIPGAWVLPPAECHYAPPVAVWTESSGNGTLYYSPGRWYRDQGATACPEPQNCTTAVNEVR